MKAIAYVFIKTHGAAVKRVIRKPLHAVFQGDDYSPADYEAHEPSPELIRKFSDRGFQFCNWHFVEVAV